MRVNLHNLTEAKVLRGDLEFGSIIECLPLSFPLGKSDRLRHELNLRGKLQPRSDPVGPRFVNLGTAVHGIIHHT